MRAQCQNKSINKAESLRRRRMIHPKPMCWQQSRRGIHVHVRVKNRRVGRQPGLGREGVGQAQTARLTNHDHGPGPGRHSGHSNKHNAYTKRTREPTAPMIGCVSQTQVSRNLSLKCRIDTIQASTPRQLPSPAVIQGPECNAPS